MAGRKIEAQSLMVDCRAQKCFKAGHMDSLLRGTNVQKAGRTASLLKGAKAKKKGTRLHCWGAKASIAKSPPTPNFTGRKNAVEQTAPP